MSEPTGTRYVLRRLNWKPAGDRIIRLPGENRIASFDSFDAAEADRRVREAEVRGRLNPFQCGTIFPTLTALPEPVFADWVADVGLTPPVLAPGPADWIAWWEAGQAEWTEEQKSRVWEGLTQVRFFEVIERPPSTVAFAVVRVMWEYNDSYYEPGAEGGRTVIAYRTREAAEKRLAELDAETREADWDDFSYVEAGRWEQEKWPLLGDHKGMPFNESGVPLYEVIEIDLGGGET